MFDSDAYILRSRTFLPKKQRTQEREKKQDQNMHRSSNGSKRPSPTTASNPIAKKSCQKPFQAMRIVVGKISPKPLQDKVRFFTTLKDDDTKDPIVDRFVQKQAKIEAPVIELTPASEFPQIDDGVRINMLTPLPHYHCKGLYDNCLDTEPHWNRFLVQGPFANASANATPGLINLTTFEKKVFKATVEDVTTAECASAMTNCAIFGRVSNHSMPATPPKTGNYRLLSSPSGMIVPVDVKLVSGEYALTDFSESTKLLGMGIFNPRGMSFYRDICRVSNNVNVGDVRFLSPRAILLRGNIVVLRSPLEHVSDPYNSGNDAQMFLNNDLPTYYDPLYDGWSDDEKPFAAEAKITSQAMCEQSQIHSKLIYDAFAEAFNHIGSVLSSKPKQTAISAIVVAGMFPAFFNGLSSHYNMIRNALIATSSLVLSPRFRLFLQPDVSCTKLTAMGMFPVPPNPAIHWMNNIDTVQKSLADKPIATVEVIVDNPAMYIADYGCASKVCVVSASEFTKNTTLHHLASQRSFYISRDPTANQGAVANYTDNSGFPAPWTLPTDPAWSPDYVIVVGDVAKPIIASSEKGANVCVCEAQMGMPSVTYVSM